MLIYRVFLLLFGACCCRRTGASILGVVFSQAAGGGFRESHGQSFGADRLMLRCVGVFLMMATTRLPPFTHGAADRVLRFFPAVHATQLCERKRELEVSAAVRGAEAREKAAEDRLKRLPEHQQQLLQVRLVH